MPDNLEDYLRHVLFDGRSTEELFEVVPNFEPCGMSYMCEQPLGGAQNQFSPLAMQHATRNTGINHQRH